MAAYAAPKGRPDWLLDADRRAFSGFMKAREELPQAAVVHAVVDLGDERAQAIEIRGSGTGWQHKYALAHAILGQLKFDPELQVGSELVQARLDAALEALDRRNVYLTTKPVERQR